MFFGHRPLHTYRPLPQDGFPATAPLHRATGKSKCWLCLLAYFQRPSLFFFIFSAAADSAVWDYFTFCDGFFLNHYPVLHICTFVAVQRQIMSPVVSFSFVFL